MSVVNRIACYFMSKMRDVQCRNNISLPVAAIIGGTGDMSPQHFQSRNLEIQQSRNFGIEKQTQNYLTASKLASKSRYK